jgi:hypothetical protein
VTLTEFVVAAVMPRAGGRGRSTGRQLTGAENRRPVAPPDPREVRTSVLVLKLVI